MKWKQLRNGIMVLRKRRKSKYVSYNYYKCKRNRNKMYNKVMITKKVYDNLIKRYS